MLRAIFKRITSKKLVVSAVNISILWVTIGAICHANTADIKDNGAKQSITQQYSSIHGTKHQELAPQNASSTPIIPRKTLSEKQLQQYRQSYQMARNAYSEKDPYFPTIKAKLKEYPLYPYLQYDEIIDKLSEFPYAEVDSFLDKHQGSYLGNRLLSQWLKELASIEHWHEYQSYYQSELKSTELQCLYLQARLNTSRELITEDVSKIWLSSRSLPNACDPLFKLWQQQGHMTQDLLWQRHRMAIKSRNKRLASFLQQKMNEDVQRLAKLYQQIYSNPEQVKVIKGSSKHKEKVSNILYDGLYRYAYYDPSETLKLFKRYRKNYAFGQVESDKLYSRIASNLIRKDKIKSARKIISSLPDEHKVKPIERLLRTLLKKQEWHKINTWIEKLPEETANSNRWQYWKARSLEETNYDSDDNSHILIHEKLSQKRSFYGFLSADKLGEQYNFEHKPSIINDTTLHKVEDIPALNRARELFLLGEMNKARQEWQYGINGLTKEELVATAQLANRWGWHRKAIESMAGAKSWDDLSIRFPVVYEDLVDKAANSFSVSPSLVFAIARQESAWEFDARSRVGATGLMQLMPATAKETAKKAGIRHRKSKLIEPQHNITLGSHYISGLLNRYNNNRPLAIAAYNAGPHRVSKWLEETGSQLPYDVWIEVIPFKETRHYVQNVLTYGVVYNHRRGQQQRLISLDEERTPL